MIIYSNNQMVTERHSSKGNQWKWQEDNIWYKADYLGYESLAEIIVSGLLKYSNIRSYVKYEYEAIQYKERRMTGCKSRNFLTGNQELLTAERLYRQQTGESFTKTAIGMETKEKIEFFVQEITEITGLQNFGEYLTFLLEVDAFFLNEDRHMHNIAVIRNDNKEFGFCPVFDNGAALLSDLNDYPLGHSLESCLERIEAKPFSTDFDEQLDAAEELYGQQIKFSFTEEIVSKILEEYIDVYDEKIMRRVHDIVLRQKRKYRYFW